LSEILNIIELDDVSWRTSLLQSWHKDFLDVLISKHQMNAIDDLSLYTTCIV
jgi:hypothetical protein